MAPTLEEKAAASSGQADAVESEAATAEPAQTYAKQVSSKQARAVEELQASIKVRACILQMLPPEQQCKDAWPSLHDIGQNGLRKAEWQTRL